MIDFNKVWKQHLNEITKLPKNFYGAIKRALEYSRFWTIDNRPNETHREHWRQQMDGEEVTVSLSTPMTVSIQHELNKLSYNLDLGVTFVVESQMYDIAGAPTGKIAGGALFTVFNESPIIQIEILPGKVNQSYIDTYIQDISSTIRHEMIHYYQIKARAENEGITMGEALQATKDQFQAHIDKNKLQLGSNDQFFPVYLKRHIEEEAYAHQAADDLLRRHGKEKALDIISRRFSWKVIANSTEIAQYVKYITPEERRNFRTKIYQYITHFDEDDMFDNKPQLPAPDPSGGMLEID